MNEEILNILDKLKKQILNSPSQMEVYMFQIVLKNLAEIKQLLQAEEQEKPESAWKMFQQLLNQTDSVKYACELCESLGVNTWEIVGEAEAIKIMKKKEKKNDNI